MAGPGEDRKARGAGERGAAVADAHPGCRSAPVGASLCPGLGSSLTLRANSVALSGRTRVPSVSVGGESLIIKKSEAPRLHSAGFATPRSSYILYIGTQRLAGDLIFRCFISGFFLIPNQLLIQPNLCLNHRDIRRPKTAKFRLENIAMPISPIQNGGCDLLV